MQTFSAPSATCTPGHSASSSSCFVISRSGRDAIRQSYQALFTIFPDWAFVSEAPILDGARIALPFSVTATHVGEFMGVAGTNRRFQIRGVMLIEMGDDGIQSEERLYDFTGFLIQVGVLRAKPGKE